MTLREVLDAARNGRKPVFHFNVATWEQFKAFARVAERVPIILGQSEGERAYFDMALLARLVRAERERGKMLYLNADHSKSVESAQRAALLGCDAVLLDVAHLPYDENKAAATAVSRFVKEKAPGVLVESELGYLQGHSDLTTEAVTIRPEDMTDPDQARDFVSAAGLDLLAVSVGEMHGISTKTKKVLDFDRIQKIRTATDAHLVLHGGSGIAADDLRRAVACGISVIHINTELRAEWRSSLDRSLREHPDTVVPYDVLGGVVSALEAKTREIVEPFYPEAKITG